MPHDCISSETKIPSMRYMKKWTERTRISHLRSVMPMPAGILPKHRLLCKCFRKDFCDQIHFSVLNFRHQKISPSFQEKMTEILYSHILLFFKALRIKQEIVDIYSQDAIFIVVWLNDVFGNDDFLKRIINLSERSDFLSTFGFIR